MREPVDPAPENPTPPTATPALVEPGASPPGAGLHAGRVLGDRYQIRDRLGAGGMGEVWLALDLKLRVEVALKPVRSEYLADEMLRDILRREVRAAREVLSPNVCRVFDLVEVEGLELVSMEYVEGATLADHLKDHGPLALGEARELAAQFLAGLEAVHDAALVHRDFKPENVMITRTGRVVVMDLGIAIPSEGASGPVAGRSTRGPCSSLEPLRSTCCDTPDRLRSWCFIRTASAWESEVVAPRRRLGPRAPRPSITLSPRGWISSIRRGSARHAYLRRRASPSTPTAPGWPASGPRRDSG